MNPVPRLPVSVLISALRPSAVLLALLFAGCSSDRPVRETESTAALSAPLEGHATFFDGRIAAEIRLSNSMAGFGRVNPEKDPAIAERRESQGGGTGSNYQMPGRDRYDQMGKGLRPGNIPSVVFHLRLTNAGKDDVNVSVSDFKSILGNFAVQPETATLAPGASVEFDPMVSSLEFVGSTTSVTLTLKLNGEKETQQIALDIVGASH